MAGSRPPGFWGHDDARIDAGTSCLAASPAPGVLMTPTPGAVPPAAGGGAVSTTDAIPATSTALKDLVVKLLGPHTFGVGVLAGMSGNVARSIVDVAGLARIFLLADLHDRANGPAGIIGLFTPLGIVHYGVAELAMAQFGDELKAARAERDALIEEVTHAVTNPGEVLANIGADYADKWRRFEMHMADGTLTGTFEAGRIFGDVLVDVLSLIGTGVAVVKLGSRIPRLVKLARTRLVRGSGAAAPPRPAGSVTTPSQLAGQPEPPVAPPKASARSAPATAVKEPSAPPRVAKGASSGRSFDPDRAGGPIQKLSTKGVKVTSGGIADVERHISRFGPDAANEHMMKRLRAIADGTLEPTPQDLNFYTHELREFQRYRNLGWERGAPSNIDEAHDLWNNAHTATLEDYGLADKDLYHPDALAAALESR